MNPTSDNGYVFTTKYNDGEVVIKIDSAGNFQWGDSLELAATGVIETDDKGYLIVGNGPYVISKTDTYTAPHIGIIKTDSLGHSNDCVHSITDSLVNIAISSSSVSYTTASNAVSIPIHYITQDIALITHDGCVPLGESVRDYNNIQNIFSIFPNPATTNLSITASAAKQSIISILNLQGQLLKQLSTNSETTNIDISNLARGMYFLQVSSEKGSAVKKFIKE
jgi:hypothetical protein